MDKISSSATPAAVSRLELLLDSWKAFDLDAKKAFLDAEATAIANNKEASVQARKVLAKQTQDFRKTSDEEKLQNIGSLLKLYQDEVDRLTKRCKSTETSFVTLYKDISDVQDPVPAIEAAIDQAQRTHRIIELEFENKKLHESHAEFHKEFQEIKNQEVTIRRLEDRLKEYDTHMETLVGEQAAANARKLRDEHIMEIELLREREAELRKQVDTAHEELSKVRRSADNTQSQLLDLQAKYGDLLASRQTEVDLLSSDLERANSLVATLEREREIWHAMQGDEGVLSNSSSLRVRKGLDLELEVAQREIEIIRLHDQLQALNNTLNAERERTTRERQETEESLVALRTRCNELTAAYESGPSRADYDSVVKELSILKAMVYGDEGEDGSSSQSTSQATSVEQVLKEKNRHLEGEVLRVKLALEQREVDIAQLSEKFAQLEATNTEQVTLITKLEEDLAKRAGGSYPATLDLLQSQQLNTSSTFTQHPLAGSADMLDIVCGQRDRYKARLSDIERENDRLSKQLESSRNESQVLRTDNVKLYEKIKYLQSYGDIASTRRGDVEKQTSSHDDELEGKYGKLYEENINPFTIFNRKERYKRYHNLNTAERVILNGSKFFLSNKSSRLFLFFYSVALHILVMASLYKLAHTSTATPSLE